MVISSSQTIAFEPQQKRQRVDESQRSRDLSVQCLGHMVSKCGTMRTVSIKTVSEAEHLVLAVSRRSDAWAWWRTTCDARGPETMSTWTQSSGKANIRRGGAVESLVTKIWSDCQIFMRKIFSCMCSHSCPPSFLPFSFWYHFSLTLPFTVTWGSVLHLWLTPPSRRRRWLMRGAPPAPPGRVDGGILGGEVGWGEGAEGGCCKTSCRVLL